MKSEYTAGYYESIEKEKEKKDSYVINYKGIYYKCLIDIEIINDHLVFDEYQRSKTTELDVLSTISALFTSIRVVFSFLYELYSKNFNNYKMIENILNQKYKNNKLIELKDFSEKKEPLMKNLNDNEKQDIRILPKYSFMQFFLNNIYCKSWKGCAKFEKQQEIIQLCNTINMRYLSLDSILYNQIMIENLFRDYKWNNSLLNNVKNSEIILKLKTLID